ncbi:MAG: glycosyltransferase family A protein [Alphaproteobacteria bacterium]
MTALSDSTRRLAPPLAAVAVTHLRNVLRKMRSALRLIRRGDLPALRAAARANFCPPRRAAASLDPALARATPDLPSAALPPHAGPSFAGTVWIGRGETAERTALVARLTESPPAARSPVVTVVIPCYNYGRFVEEAAASALDQTIGALEVIVVNDGSSDPCTIEALDRLNDPRVHVINQANAGLPSARNSGIARARGKYICCLDADDTIEPSYLEKAVAVMERRPDVGFAYSWVRFFGGEDMVWQTAPFDLDRIVKENHVSVAAVFRRDLWAAAGGYSPLMRDGYEDWEFWVRLGSLGVAGWCLPEPLLNHRRHGRSMSDEALDIHEELVGRIRALNPEAFDPAFRERLKAARKLKGNSGR